MLLISKIYYIVLINYSITYKGLPVTENYVVYDLLVHALNRFMQELRKTESSLRTERDQWRDQATANKHEVEKLRGVFNFRSLEIWILRTSLPTYRDLQKVVVY